MWLLLNFEKNLDERWKNRRAKCMDKFHIRPNLMLCKFRKYNNAINAVYAGLS